MKTRFNIAALFFFGLITLNSFSQKIIWKPKAEIPYEIYSGSAVTCQDTIYFIGGQKDIGSGNYIASNMMFEYNLEADEWIEKPNMLTARFNIASASVNGKIYVLGGDQSFLDNNEMYDPATEIWQALAPMPTGRQHIKAAVVDNKIYIIGGLESWSTVSTKNEVYDPTTNTWEEKAPIPIPKHNYSTVVYNDKIYIFGGCTQNGGNIWVKTSTVEVYDPATNTWDTTSSLPSTRFNPGIGLINDKMIIVGGFAANYGAIAGVDFFDPATDFWSLGNSLPKKNVAMGSTTLDNKIYIIGGTDGSPYWNGYNTVYEGTVNDSANLTPEVYYPLIDDTCEVNENLIWLLPDFTFVDDDTLTYSAALTNGNELPAWLSFDDDGTFTGIPDNPEILSIIITAIDNYDASVSDTFNLVVESSPEGIDQFINKDGLLIFPNPAINYIHVNTSNLHSKFIKFQILTIDGKIIKEGRLESKRISISDLNKGVFLLNIITKKRIITNKIVIK